MAGRAKEGERHRNAPSLLDRSRNRLLNPHPAQAFCSTMLGLNGPVITPRTLSASQSAEPGRHAAKGKHTSVLSLRQRE
jgi:hypothetical protein